jgi:flagellar hook assembly protein FlgD
MASSILPLGSSTAADTGQETLVKSASDPFANKEVFLKLLVAQLQHQNPLNPMDGMQFVSQLAQFSELEQIIGIREGVTKLASQNAANPASDQNETQPA